MSEKTNSCPICSTLFTDNTCNCFVANRHLDCSPEACKQAAEDFLCGDTTYAKASYCIMETGDTRDIDYWIERYFEDSKPLDGG